MLHEDEIPSLMTRDDVSEYLGVSAERATELLRGWPVVGTYVPPRGAVVPLYSSDDVVTRCEAGHLLPPRHSGCRACKFQRQLARTA